jgi:hypothetical protein
MNKYFIKRGNKTITIDFNDEKLNIEIAIPTNKDHDSLMEEFSEVGVDGMMITHGADFIEKRLIKFIINLPFEIPVNQEMDIFKMWIDCTDDEKIIAINYMDPKLRDIINNEISGISSLSEDETGN